MPLLLLCTLYMAVAQRLGLGLRLVSIRDEVQQLRQARGKARGEARTVRGRGAPAADEDDPTYDPEPTYLLQLPGTAEQRELYVDVRAEGRLRSTHDLAAFLHPSLRALPSDRIREFVTPLSHQTYCVQAPRPPAAHPHPPHPHLRPRSTRTRTRPQHAHAHAHAHARTLHAARTYLPQSPLAPLTLPH